MATKKRIYAVKPTDTEAPKTRLVRAATKGQAIAYVCRGSHIAEVPSQDELIEIVGNGVKVEDAGDEPAEQAEQEAE